MRTLTLLCVVSIASVTYARSSHAQSVQITIDSIVQNGSISGHVTGLEKSAEPHYRVVVYIHTDNWYIHPYAGQGKGKSWAAIESTGSWSIKTIKREFVADEIAALVVNDSLTLPPRIDAIDDIPHVGIIKKDLGGTPDYGKL